LAKSKSYEGPHYAVFRGTSTLKMDYTKVSTQKTIQSLNTHHPENLKIYKVNLLGKSQPMKMECFHNNELKKGTFL
jgi:hypothetical protein